jgi:serine/threonine-protein kinase
MLTDPHARAGRSLGRYRILGAIAAGGMGTVCVAKVGGVGGFERKVAVKILHPHLAMDEDFVAMFLDEARLAARIHHPNVVATLDVMETPELAIVMELIECAHLGALVRRSVREGGRLPSAVVLRIVLDALAGLAAAHELKDDEGTLLGLVHRDVSPQNILVGADGVTRLTDFGVARAESRLAATRDGSLKGKLAYMAPEQIIGAPIDQRADLFAMAVVLWEALAGQRLFAADSDAEITARVSSAPIPRISAIVPELAPLDAVLAQGLARDPSTRFGTAREMLAAIEDAGVSIATTRMVASTVERVALDVLDQMRSVSGLSVQALTPSDLKRPGDESSQVSTAYSLPSRSDDPTRVSQSARRSRPEPVDVPAAIVTGPAPAIITGPAPAITTGPLPALAPSPPSRAPQIVALGAGVTVVAVLVAGGAWMLFGRTPPAVDEGPPPTTSTTTTSTAPSLEGTLRIAGSDTLGAELLPSLAETFEQAHQGVHVVVEAHGSSTAFVSLFDRSADIGASSRPIREDELDEAARLGLTLRETTIGWDGIAIVMHPDHALPSLDIATVRSLFVGDDVPEALRSLHPLTRPVESGTHAFFAERVLEGAEPTTRAITLEHNYEVIDYVSADRDAIAYVPAGVVTDAVRVIPILDAHRVARSPTRSTIADGAYPLARPLLLFVRERPGPLVAAFLELMASEAGRAAIDGHGFVAAGSEQTPAWLASLGDAAAVDTAPPLRIVFARESATPPESTRPTLESWLREHADRASIVVQGHAGEDEPEADRLSRTRAEAVAASLVAAGADAASITTVGLGLHRPLGALGSVSRREQGPRVEVFALSP